MGKLLLIDIDGTLTDATTTWGGPELGWCQTYCVRDGEAIKRIASSGVLVAALSRNRTRCARVRMESLGIGTRWLGVADKVAALAEALAYYNVTASHAAYLGDGPEDSEVFRRVALGVAVADAHPTARAAAHVVLTRAGGARAVEEFEAYLAANGWPAEGCRGT